MCQEQEKARVEKANKDNKKKKYDFSLILDSSKNLQYLISRKLLDDYNILVIFTGRQGGVSSKPYKSLNLAFHVGDKPSNVVANRLRLAKTFNFDLSRLTCAEQIHSSAIAIIDEQSAGRGALSFDDAISGVDSLITTSTNIPLALFYADCVPIVLVDPIKRVASVVHAGWRGIYTDIITKTISSFINYGLASIENTLAFIGPAIGMCCYEVSKDLVDKFMQKLESKHKGIISATWLNENKIDLPKITEYQLIAAGVIHDNIYKTHYCTSCHSDKFFSYRAEKGITGRHAAIVNILE